MTCSGLELKTDQTAVSKHVGILPKNKGGGGGNNAKIWIKTVYSATVFVCLAHSVIWCGGSLKCDGLQCGSTCSVVVLWWVN